MSPITAHAGDGFGSVLGIADADGTLHDGYYQLGDGLVLDPGTGDVSDPHFIDNVGAPVVYDVETATTITVADDNATIYLGAAITGSGLHVNINTDASHDQLVFICDDSGGGATPAIYGGTAVLPVYPAQGETVIAIQKSGTWRSRVVDRKSNVTSAALTTDTLLYASGAHTIASLGWTRSGDILSGPGNQIILNPTGSTPAISVTRTSHSAFLAADGFGSEMGWTNGSLCTLGIDSANVNPQAYLWPIAAGTSSQYLTLDPVDPTRLKFITAPFGSGTVTHSGSVTDLHLAIFDGPTGDIIKDGGAVPTSLPPSGPAGGDFAGSTYPNPVIAAGAVSVSKMIAASASRLFGSGSGGTTAIELVAERGVTIDANGIGFDPGGVEASLGFTDITTANASTSQHGLLRKLDGTGTHYLDGSGNWTTPTGTIYTWGDALSITGSTINWLPDNTTLEVSSDIARVKAGGIGSNEIANASVAGVDLNLNATNPCIEDVTGLRVKVDSTTIGRTASGLTNLAPFDATAGITFTGADAFTNATGPRFSGVSLATIPLPTATTRVYLQGNGTVANFSAFSAALTEPTDTTAGQVTVTLNTGPVGSGGTASAWFEIPAQYQQQGNLIKLLSVAFGAAKTADTFQVFKITSIGLAKRTRTAASATCAFTDIVSDGSDQFSGTPPSGTPTDLDIDVTDTVTTAGPLFLHITFECTTNNRSSTWVLDFGDDRSLLRYSTAS